MEILQAQPDTNTTTPATPSAAAAHPPEATATTPAQAAIPADTNTAIMGVLPNYRTADASQEKTTITARQKLDIARKDSFAPSLIGVSAFFAGISQATGQPPSYGGGMAGYGKRWVANYADQTMGNMFAEGVFPALLHQDPRYFRRGTGSTGYRIRYALTRVLITKNDSGRYGFNYSEWLGNMSGVAISNVYYPNNRNVSSNVNKVLVQVGTDAISQVLKEFWPDIHRKLKHQK